MRGLPTPVSVPVMGPTREVPPCGAGSFLSVQKGTKETPGNAPGGTTAPRAFRLGPAVRFPPAPRCERRGPWTWHRRPARVGTTHSSPVCATAAGVSNGHAHPAVVSRLDWQNRGSRCEISGRAKAEDISSQGRLPAARKAFPPQGGRCHGGCRDG